MSVFYPCLIALPILLAAAFAQRRSPAGSTRDVWGGLARMGFGVAKIVLLAMPLERMVDGVIHAEPLAHNLISAWMGGLGFTFQLYFALSGAVDLLLGVRKVLGWSVVESFQEPFVSGGFTGFWRGWNAGLIPVGHRTTALRHAAGSAALVLLCVILWRGASGGTIIWAAVQLLLLGLEWWRGGRSLFLPLPPPFRVALTAAVILLTNMLLYMPDLAQSWAEIQHLVGGPPVTVYSVLLDERVTTPWPKYTLWLAMLLSVTARPVQWVLSQAVITGRVSGIALGLLACGMWMRERPVANTDSWQAIIKHGLQWPLAKGLQEGNAEVFVGRAGWLFRQAELDHLTRARSVPGLGSALIDFAAQLKSSQVPMLVVSVPDKAGLYPQHILPAEYPNPVQPPGYVADLERLRAAGITVLDATERLWSLRKQFPLYFTQDSHWTPEAMKEVARLAAKQIRQAWPQVTSDETPLINADILERADAGDLAHALDPWSPESIGAAEATQLISISGLKATEASPILLLGGDLVRVFEDPTSSFGNAEGKPQNAGFATQLASLLGRSLDTKWIIERGTRDSTLSKWLKDASKKKLVVIVVRAGDL